MDPRKNSGKLSTIKFLGHMKDLDLQENNLTKIPEWMFNMKENRKLLDSKINLLVLIIPYYFPLRSTQEIFDC